MNYFETKTMDSGESRRSTILKIFLIFARDGWRSTTRRKWTYPDGKFTFKTETGTL